MTRNNTWRFMDGISTLNDEGMKVLLGEMSEMVKNPEYTKRDDDADPADDFEELDGIQKRYAHIDPANIEYMGLAGGEDGEPCLMVLHNEYDEDATRYDFPLCHGWQVYIANCFLRSLDLGVYVSFESFREYAEMVGECWKRLQVRQGGGTND